MKLTETLRDRAAARMILDPADPRFVTGTPAEQERARRDWRMARFSREVVASDLPEIPRSQLQTLHGRLLEDTETGSFYLPRRDGLIDLSYVPDAVAYYCDPTGAPVLLERPATGAKSRAEMEQLQAARKERRRNRPKPRWRER